jgi:hypothetical protein
MSYHEYAELAIYGNLPIGFNQWDLADENGWTVAEGSYLPADFDRWELANNKGWTVAHAAASWGWLPDNFDQLGLTDKDGLTILDSLLLSRDNLAAHMSRWEEERPLCKADIDWNAFKTTLPEIYQKYSISGRMLDIDSDQEAFRGALL